MMEKYTHLWPNVRLRIDGLNTPQSLPLASTDQILSLYDCRLGAFFCKGIRIPEILSEHPDCHVFPVNTPEARQQENLCLATKRYRKKAPCLVDFCRLFRAACSELVDQDQPVDG